MNLAVILGVCWLSLGWLNPGWLNLGSPQNPTPSQPQTPQSQNAEPTQSAPDPTTQAPTPPAQTKPSPNRPRHHKKTIPPNCSNAPAATNPTVGAPADSTNSTGAGSDSTGSTDAGSTEAGSAAAGSTDGGSAKAGSANPSAPTLPPCPPPKKVVRNGGSNEPAIQLTGGTPAEQSVHQRSTEELTFATEENLKRIEGRKLSPSQQEMVNQIKQFMEQSKTAVAAGDLERGHNLALKAHLLSDELVKP
jgi:hypothetical protein